MKIFLSYKYNWKTAVYSLDFRATFYYSRFFLLYISMHMFLPCSCTHTHAGLWVWRSEVRFNSFLQFLSMLFFEIWSFTQSRTQQFSYTGWSVSSRLTTFTSQHRYYRFMLLYLILLCILMDWIQIFMFAQRALNQLSHLPTSQNKCSENIWQNKNALYSEEIVSSPLFILNSKVDG